MKTHHALHKAISRQSDNPTSLEKNSSNPLFGDSNYNLCAFNKMTYLDNLMSHIIKINVCH